MTWSGWTSPFGATSGSCQSLTVPSSAADRSWLPAGFRASAVSGRLVAEDDLGLLAGRLVPEADGRVGTAGGEELPVGADGDRRHGPGVAGELPLDRSLGGVPDAHELVGGAGVELLAVGAGDGGEDAVGMSDDARRQPAARPRASPVRRRPP